MAGAACTLRCIPAREIPHPIDVFAARVHPPRKAVAECPRDTVFVNGRRKDARAVPAGGAFGSRLVKRGAASAARTRPCRGPSGGVRLHLETQTRRRVDRIRLAV